MDIEGDINWYHLFAYFISWLLIGDLADEIAGVEKKIEE